MRSRQTWAGILLFTPGHRWVKDIKIKIKTCLEREGLSPEGLARGKKVGESHYFLSPSPSWKIHREKLAGGTTIQDPGRQASFLTSGSFSELLASPQFPENYHLPFNLLHNLPSLSLSYVSLDILVSSCSPLKSHWKCQGLGTWSELNPD